VRLAFASSPTAPAGASTRKVHGQLELQWGNPREPEAYACIRAYSPYDNVKAQVYPAMLATAALNDTQVMYWNPAKWVAKLRAMKTDNNVIVLVTNMASGHSGASGRLEKYRLTALKYAFMLNLLGKTE